MSSTFALSRQVGAKPCRRTNVVVRSKDFSAEAGSLTLTKEQLPAERYVATNRFEVKNGAKFEQRWTTRKSKLAVLDGFRYFSLLRRVGRQPGEAVPEDEPNYVSFTIWDDKPAFDSWRTGEAFKEAHGGGTLWGFVSMLVNASQTLRGAPKPAFYEGLLPIATEPDMSGKRVAEGWRVVESDGTSTLDAECFVAMNRFKVVQGREAEFEARWKGRETKLREFDGFKAFTLARRDAVTPDDGFQYSTMSVWRDRAAFDGWFAKQQSKEKDPKAEKPDMSIYNGRPSPVFYEGVLVLESAVGA